MKNIFLYLFAFLLVGLLILACEKKQEYPPFSSLEIFKVKNIFLLKNSSDRLSNKQLTKADMIDSFLVVGFLQDSQKSQGISFFYMNDFIFIDSKDTTESCFYVKEVPAQKTAKDTFWVFYNWQTLSGQRNAYVHINEKFYFSNFLFGEKRVRVDKNKRNYSFEFISVTIIPKHLQKYKEWKDKIWYAFLPRGWHYIEDSLNKYSIIPPGVHIQISYLRNLEGED